MNTRSQSPFTAEVIDIRLVMLKYKTKTYPLWARHAFPGLNWKRKYDLAKDSGGPAWDALRARSWRHHKARVAAIARGKNPPSPAQLRRRGKPLQRKSFAGRLRKLRPSASLSQKEIKRRRDRARRKRSRLLKQIPSGLRLVVPRANKRLGFQYFNVPLLQRYIDLELDDTPWISKALIAALKANGELSHSFWRAHGIGRQYAEPWPSPASMNSKARACFFFETDVDDLDMSAAHHRIVLSKCKRYGMKRKALAPLQKYVDDPDGWRKRIADECGCALKHTKRLSIILLNSGSLGCWFATAKCRISISDDTLDELRAFRDCCRECMELILRRETHILPLVVRRFPPATRYHYLLCFSEDVALRAIADALRELGVLIIALVYDGLMIHSHGVSRELVQQRATAAASKALNCDMPVRVKDMKLPKVMSEIDRLCKLLDAAGIKH